MDELRVLLRLTLRLRLLLSEHTADGGGGNLWGKLKWLLGDWMELWPLRLLLLLLGQRCKKFGRVGSDLNESLQLGFQVSDPLGVILDGSLHFSEIH